MEMRLASTMKSDSLRIMVVVVSLAALLVALPSPSNASVGAGYGGVISHGRIVYFSPGLGDSGRATEWYASFHGSGSVTVDGANYSGLTYVTMDGSSNSESRFEGTGSVEQFKLFFEGNDSEIRGSGTYARLGPIMRFTLRADSAELCVDYGCGTGELEIIITAVSRDSMQSSCLYGSVFGCHLDGSWMQRQTDSPDASPLPDSEALVPDGLDEQGVKDLMNATDAIGTGTRGSGSAFGTQTANKDSLLGGGSKDWYASVATSGTAGSDDPLGTWIGTTSYDIDVAADGSVTWSSSFGPLVYGSGGGKSVDLGSSVLLHLSGDDVVVCGFTCASGDFDLLLLLHRPAAVGGCTSDCAVEGVYVQSLKSSA